MHTEFRHLGRKTFFLLMLHKALIGVAFFFILIVLIALKPYLLPTLATLMATPLGTANAMYNLIMGVCLFLFVTLFAVSLLITWLEYIYYKFKYDHHAFTIRRGIFHIQEFSIPYNKIQNVTLERPLIYRLFGVSKMVITTIERADNDPREKDEEGVVEMIDKEIAIEIQKELTTNSNILTIVPHE